MSAPSLKFKSLAFLIFMLVSAITVFPFLSLGKAETKIISINPSSGYVGTVVNVRGNITSENGVYVLQFDGVNVTSGNAVGFEVNVTFSVPRTFAGNHNVTLIDGVTGENYTGSFQVLPSFTIQIDVPEPPRQLQEGDSVAISINVTGGERSTTYVANVTVQTPTNASYPVLVDVATSELGDGNRTLIYPQDFPGANTNFVGGYVVFLNTTVANQTFFVGLTNSTEYHRFQSVDIKAAGYAPNENVTAFISFDGEKIFSPENLTATEEGIVHINWIVPSNASMGTYTVNITSASTSPTVKAVPDIQSFAVPGFDVNITARNLAEEPVSNVTLRIFENEKSVGNVTTNQQGLAGLKLEVGDYVCMAYFKGERVGEQLISVEGASSFYLSCNLTNLRITILNENGIRIPEAKIHLTPENKTLITDVDGVAVAHSLLPSVNYTLNVSRYGIPFNVTTIFGLLINQNPVAWFDITIFCPSFTLRVNVYDVNYNPIDKAVVEVQDLMGGLRYVGVTGSEGIATFNCTLGNYSVRVYGEEGTKLNETVIGLFESKELSVYCRLYGIDVAVRVLDYFGQPLGNVNVMLQREGLQPRSTRTQADGIAKFENVIGGGLTVKVYLGDRQEPDAVKTFFVDGSVNPASFDVKVERYVLLGGLLVETGQFATAIIIVVSVALVILIEIYRRKPFKFKKSPS
ncbi:MAG: hypothetical protein QW667_01220 [Candidatus Bathyarchaeia archaeon]